MTIDFSRIITASDKAAETAVAHARTVKAECAGRIIAVLDERTLLNVQGAVLAGELDAAEMEIFRAGRQWVADMQEACRIAIATGRDASWPALPEGVGELAERF